MSYKSVFDGKSDKKNISRSGGSDAILAKLFYNIIHDTHITMMRWNDLMNIHIRDPRNSIPNNKRDQSSERGNLQKELFKEKMTWKVFCKGMRLLNYVKFELSFKIHHQNGKVTVHSAMVNLGESNEMLQSYADDETDTKTDSDKQMEIEP